MAAPHSQDGIETIQILDKVYQLVTGTTPIKVEMLARLVSNPNRAFVRDFVLDARESYFFVIEVHDSFAGENPMIYLTRADNVRTRNSQASWTHLNSPSHKDLEYYYQIDPPTYGRPRLEVVDD